MTLIRLRNTVSGQIAYVDEKMLEHPVFGQYLERVEADAKPFVPGMFASGTVAEREKSRPAKADPEKDDK